MGRRRRCQPIASRGMIQPRRSTPAGHEQVARDRSPNGPSKPIRKTLSGLPSA